MKMYAAKDQVKVLGMAQDGATVVCKLHFGQPVEIVREEEEYYKVEVQDNVYGYVLRVDLTETAPASNANRLVGENMGWKEAFDETGSKTKEKFDFAKFWLEYGPWISFFGIFAICLAAVILGFVLNGWKGGITTIAMAIGWIVYNIHCSDVVEEEFTWKFQKDNFLWWAVGLTIALPVLVYLIPWASVWEFLRLTAEASGSRTAKGWGILFSAYTLLPTLYTALLPTSLTLFVWAGKNEDRVDDDGVKWWAFAVLVGLFLISLWWAVGIMVYIGNIWYLAATAMTAILAFFGAIRVANEAPLRWS